MAVGLRHDSGRVRRVTSLSLPRMRARRGFGSRCKSLGHAFDTKAFFEPWTRTRARADTPRPCNISVHADAAGCAFFATFPLFHRLLISTQSVHSLNSFLMIGGVAEHGSRGVLGARRCGDMGRWARLGRPDASPLDLTRGQFYWIIPQDTADTAAGGPFATK